MISWLPMLLAGAAHAQVEVCTEPYSRIQFGAAVGKVDDAFADRDLYAAKDQLNVIGERIVCLDEVVDRTLFAKFTRFMAINYFYDQDEEAAMRWGRASKLASPDLSWDEGEYPGDHPLRVLLREAPVAIVIADDAHGLAPPKGGGVFRNGDLLVVPQAYGNTPVLIQVFDADQALVGGYWQDGGTFRGWVLDDKIRDAEAPKWWTGDGPSSFSSRPTAVAAAPTPKPKPVRSTGGGGGGGGSVLPLVASGGLVVASGVTYALAGLTAGRLDEQASSEDLTQVRSTANALVVASGATLAAGVGVGIGGVLASGGTGVRVHVRF